jgi:hypothetical protein
MQTVIDLAKLRGWLVYHTLNSRGSAAGFPDLVLARDGDVVFAEVKIGNNKPTKAQQIWLDALPTNLIGVYLWTPDDWSEIEERLR